jgi:hypothetical protein
MNLFILDHDHTLNAQYHIDLHVGKMQLEAVQLMTTTLWVDKLLGYVPRALEKEERDELTRAKKLEPSIEERQFTRYLPTHVNHPCAIWARTSDANFNWIGDYVLALNEENKWRGFKDHASCAELLRLPEPQRLTCEGLTPFAQAMPDEYRSPDPVDAYRHYYMGEKANMAVWRKRGKPDWWDDMLVTYSKDDPHEAYKKTVIAKVNKGKPWSKMGVVGGGR